MKNSERKHGAALGWKLRDGFAKEAQFLLGHRALLGAFKGFYSQLL